MSRKPTHKPRRHRFFSSDGATGADINAKFTLNFSEAVKRCNGTIQLKDAAGTVKGMSCNNYAGSIYDFTTGTDTAAPGINHSSPAPPPTGRPTQTPMPISF